MPDAPQHSFGGRTESSWARERTKIFVGLGGILVILTLGIGITRFSHEASAESRRERRAFSGAPPVIPHARQSGKCVTCHSATGTTRPPLGAAPANPHLKTTGMSEFSNCRQCHVFQKEDKLFVANEFQPLPPALHGSRAFPHAPPTIPHAVFMRESCTSCHSGDAARPEIRCTHVERTNCRQCHVRENMNEPSRL